MPVPPEEDPEKFVTVKVPRKFFAQIGHQGGAVKGESKRRGDSAYYRNLRMKRKDQAK